MRQIAIAESRSIGTRTITLVLAFSVAAFISSGVSYAKPPSTTTLNATLCKALGGEWTTGPYTCTIPPGIDAVASSNFKIGDDTTLDIQGSLEIPTSVTVTCTGIIQVKNARGAVPDIPALGTWEVGLLIYGTLNNSGTIVVDNSYDPDTSPALGTEGITILLSAAPPTPGSELEMSIVPGALINSGTITIQNSGDLTRGIKNLGNLTNAASGRIEVANTVGTSVGLYNRRVELGQTWRWNAVVTNSGSVTVKNTGDFVGMDFESDPASPNGYGVYNVGFFMNTATGKFTIDPNEGLDTAIGLFVSGVFTNYGTFRNNRGVMDQTWGSVNPSGTMINYGTTLVGLVDSTPIATGTFYNHLVMMNLGTITSYGLMADDSADKTMINYGTIYNHGRIDAGVNHGLCIDESDGQGGC